MFLPPQRRAELNQLLANGRKQCATCKEIKPVSEFRPQPKDKTGLRPWCKPCDRMKNKHSYERHREKRLAKARIANKTEHRRKWNREYQAQRLRKMRNEAATRLRPTQCEICGKRCVVCFDHDHENGEFRGWLCDTCNRVLGLVHDDPITLRKLADYLEDSNAQ